MKDDPVLKAVLAKLKEDWPTLAIDTITIVVFVILIIKAKSRHHILALTRRTPKMPPQNWNEGGMDE